MLQTVSALGAIVKWLENDVLRGIQFQTPAVGERLDQYELATPAVHIGWIPHGGILQQTQIPCLVVGLDGSESDDDSTDFQIQITAAIYDPGHQDFSQDDELLQLQPNFDGYVTLLNLLDHVRACLLREGKIADQFELVGGVKLKTYEEQPWPYWYGCLRFAIFGEAYPQTAFAKFLE